MTELWKVELWEAPGWDSISPWTEGTIWTMQSYRATADGLIWSPGPDWTSWASATKPWSKSWRVSAWLIWQAPLPVRTSRIVPAIQSLLLSKLAMLKTIAERGKWYLPQRCTGCWRLTIWLLNSVFQCNYQSLKIRSTSMKHIVFYLYVSRGVAWTQYRKQKPWRNFTCLKVCPC